jgi:S-adenosylmethionine synthetase
MGVRTGDRIRLTISRAFIGRHLANVDAYAAACRALTRAAARVAGETTHVPVAVRVNAADDISRGQGFLTITGSSAEAGDDGQTGRGNRANGLITPFRPMTLEAAAGKNPISRVGKLHNVAANRLAAAVVANVAEIVEAYCHLASEIEARIDEPQLAYLQVRTAEARLADSHRASHPWHSNG